MLTTIYTAAWNVIASHPDPLPWPTANNPNSLPYCDSRTEPGAGVSCYVDPNLPLTDTGMQVPGVKPFTPPSPAHFQMSIMDLILPLFLLAMGCGGMYLLWRREAAFTAFIQYAALCIGISVLVYHPVVLVNVASYLGGVVGVGG